MKLILETGFTRKEKRLYSGEFDADSVYSLINRLLPTQFAVEETSYGLVYKGINCKGFSASIIVK